MTEPGPAAESAFETIRRGVRVVPGLGDVTLRYEPSMLIGETALGQRTWRPTASWALGLSTLVAALGLFLLNAPFAALVIVVAVAGLALGAASWLEQLEKRRRRFVVNYETYSLRLDFSTPFAGMPRTLVVHFDGVRAVALEAQGPGLWCLTVDFVPEPGSAQLLREVLAAFIPEAQLTDARRLERLLRGAFGLSASDAHTDLHAPAD